MGLYVVPQSADVTDPTVAAAVARWKLRAPKPAAITGTGTGAIIVQDSTIALHLESGYDAVRSALGDRMTEGATLLQIDAQLDKAAMAIASTSLFQARGMNRQEGADSSIETAGKAAEAYLERCRPGGGGGKSENPRFLTSDNVTTADAPVLTSAMGQPGGSGRSDAWIEPRADLAGGRGEWH